MRMLKGSWAQYPPPSVEEASSLEISCWPRRLRDAYSILLATPNCFR